MHLTDIIAEFYASNEDDLLNMSRVVFASTKIRSSPKLLQALVVGAEGPFLLQEFKLSDIEKAYKDLGLLLIEMQSRLGEPCMLIGDKDDAPIVGHFICEVLEITASIAVVSIGVFEESVNDK